MAFLMRQLNTGSIGGSLKSLRKRQGKSLDMVSRQIQIQRKYLDAFERDANHELPDQLYARHFLKQYVEALGGDVSYFLSRYDEECGSCPAVVDSLRLPKQRVARRLLQQWRSVAGKTIIALLASALIVYIGLQVYALLSPPPLIVDSPNADLQTANATLIVSGQTSTETTVTVNDEPVLTDPTGRFTSRMTLTRGLNIITVEASKKHSRPQVIHRSVYLEDLGEARGEKDDS